LTWRAARWKTMLPSFWGRLLCVYGVIVSFSTFPWLGSHCCMSFSSNATCMSLRKISWDTILILKETFQLLQLTYKFIIWGSLGALEMTLNKYEQLIATAVWQFEILLQLWDSYTMDNDRSSATFVCNLTPNGPLSLRGTNGISGRYLWSQFLSWFFETFFEDRKTE